MPQSQPFHPPHEAPSPHPSAAVRTATLLLIPTGTQTLATQFWAYSSNLSYGAAAPFAAAMLGVAVVPTYLLGRWFDRLPSRTTVST